MKCDNLLLTQDGTIKVTDFGASKSVEGMGTRGGQTMIGTPFFMAPEMLNSGEDVDEGYGRRADVWSMGITILEMMNCGKVPWPDFGSVNAAIMFIAADGSLPRIPDTLSDDGRDFIQRCCNRDPVQRSTSEELQGHPWVNILSDSVARSGSSVTFS